MNRSGRKGHSALYGDVVIPRGYCLDCDSYAFIIDNELRCCGKRVEDPEFIGFKKMSDCVAIRRGPSRKWQEAIIRTQGGKCFYCDRRFGSCVWRSGKQISLRLHWDHVNPWIYSLSNKDQNFVAACHVCNGIKSSLIFGSIDEARTHITEKWQVKGYSDVRPLRIALHRHTDATEIL